MSLSEVVDEQYRIGVEDLHGREREWIVANISYQGLEDMVPVLHFEGMTKRLVLDQEQSRQMVALTRTALPEEWIGAHIRVTPRRKADSDGIDITAATLASSTEQGRD
jgi:hypothetical protein